MGQPRQFDPEERLDRAMNAFWENGFDRIGMQDLCKAMDLFPGSVYGTYGGKRDLFLKAIDRYMATCSAEGVAILDREASGIVAIRRYFGQLVHGIIEGHRRWGCLVTNTLVELSENDPEIKEKVDRHLVRLEAAFDAAIARGKDQGEISQGIPNNMAAFLVCLVQGLNVIARTRPSRARLEAMVNAGLSTLDPGAVTLPR